MKQRIGDKYTVVIGLEIHAQLSTNSKIYAPDATVFGAEPNTQVSVITLGHPGTLPIINKKVLEYAIRMGLACNSEITRFNIFCRKNYFYPDLPKGYQLTQDRTPICIGGGFTLKDQHMGERFIRLNRIHVEEDAGKSIHAPNDDYTMVDLNRAGMPLIEIVTEPDLRSSEEAAHILTEVRRLVRYLHICDGNMEEGSLRCDANVSLMPDGATTYGQKVELKNMNSIRNVKNAIDHEVERQMALLDRGERVVSETRTYNPTTGLSQSLRMKEELTDYRYFPEPDLSPVVVTDEWLEEIKANMPPLPSELYEKFISEYGIPEYDAQVLTDSRDMAEYFQAICVHTSNYKAASNWLMGPVKSALNNAGQSIQDFALVPRQLAEVIRLIDEGLISFSIASQKLFPALLEKPDAGVETLASELNLIQKSDSGFIVPVVHEVLAKYPDQVKLYKKGKKGLLGMFMGEVMKRTQGKADPKVASQLLRETLES